MTNCFECGGILKNISKPGRLIIDNETGEYFLVPKEMNISTCISCGYIHEDIYLETRLEKIISGQKKQNTQEKLIYLRWVQKKLDKVLDKLESKDYLDKNLINQMILLLSFRQVVAYPTENDPSIKLQKKLVEFLDKKAGLYREFCDLVTNTKYIGE